MYLSKQNKQLKNSTLNKIAKGNIVEYIDLNNVSIKIQKEKKKKMKAYKIERPGA